MSRKIKIGLVYRDNTFSSPINPDVTRGWADASDPCIEEAYIARALIEDSEDRFEVYNVPHFGIDPDTLYADATNLETGEEIHRHIDTIADVLFVLALGKAGVPNRRQHLARENELLAKMHSDALVPVVNNIPSILAYRNRPKSYLFDLQERGVPVAPSRLAHSIDQVRAYGEELGGTYVTKPVSGFGGIGIEKFPDGDEETVRRQLKEWGEVIVQRFIPEIVTEGERSFFLIEGVPRYGILKSAPEGSFKVNAEYGADKDLSEVYKRMSPTAEEKALCVQALEALPIDPEIVRIDCVGFRDRPMIGEVTKNCIGTYANELGALDEIVNGYIGTMLINTARRSPPYVGP